VVVIVSSKFNQNAHVHYSGKATEISTATERHRDTGTDIKGENVMHMLHHIGFNEMKKETTCCSKIGWTRTRLLSQYKTGENQMSLTIFDGKK